MAKKTCFVIIGFGPKTDLETGRIIDLDKTFENLIKPAFEELNIECFRAKEVRHTGIIDLLGVGANGYCRAHTQLTTQNIGVCHGPVVVAYRAPGASRRIVQLHAALVR